MAASYESVLRNVESLSRAEQLRLISEMAEHLRTYGAPEARTSILRTARAGQRNLARH